MKQAGGSVTSTVADPAYVYSSDDESAAERSIWPFSVGSTACVSLTAEAKGSLTPELSLIFDDNLTESVRLTSQLATAGE